MIALTTLAARADVAQEREAGAHLRKTIAEAVGSGQNEVSLPKGTYRLSTPKGQVAALDLKGVQNLVINGNGSTLIAEDMRGLFSFRNCRNITLRNITFDLDPLPYVQGTIADADDKARTITVKVDPMCAGLEVLDTYFALKLAVLFSADDKRLVPGYADCGVDKITKLENGLIRIKLTPYNEQMGITQAGYVPGVCVTLTGKGKPIIEQFDCGGMVFEDVTLHASAGLAVYERAAIDQTVYRRCAIVRKPGSGRLVAGNADGFHSSMARVGPLYEDCRVEALCDDAFAVHGFFSVLLEQPSETTLEIAPLLRRDFDVGSQLTFYDVQTLEPLGTAQVKNYQTSRAKKDLKRAKELPAKLTRKGQRVVRFSSEEILTVELDRPIQLPPHALIEATDWCSAGTVMRNCSVENLRGRAFLFQSINALVENSKATWLSLPAIEISGDMPWMQGPFCRDVVLRNNVIKDVGLSVSAQASYRTALGAISIHSYYGGSFLPGLQSQHAITIEGNDVRGAHIPALAILNASHVRIANNTFAGNRLTPAPTAGQALGIPTNYDIIVAGSKAVELSDNTVTGPDGQAGGSIGINP